MISRRQFLLTAAATITGALLSGIVQAEKPVPVEDIQAVPLEYDGRSNALDTVDRTQYDSFEVIETGTDEYGSYWVAKVKKDGNGYLAGNYYCI